MLLVISEGILDSYPSPDDTHSLNTRARAHTHTHKC